MENNTKKAIHACHFHVPPVYGWIESRLNQDAMNFLWDAINAVEDRASASIRSSLAGQLSTSFAIQDQDQWFTKNVLYHLEQEYSERWGRKHAQLNTFHDGPCDLELQHLWVNYQKQGEYNPMHHHSGIYSFVVWMRNPADPGLQHMLPNSAGSSYPKNNEFSFTYLNTLGKLESHSFPMGREEEGMILFFPSALNHGVTPFYECDEERVSVSGNLWLKTRAKSDD
jgi:hypothetical protein